jgi:DNA-binding XRE family transcriptional regulator
MWDDGDIYEAGMDAAFDRAARQAEKDEERYLKQIAGLRAQLAAEQERVAKLVQVSKFILSKLDKEYADTGYCANGYLTDDNLDEFRAAIQAGKG